MTWARLRSRLDGGSDDGFTLIELIVAGALMAMISVLVAQTVTGGIRVSARGEKRTDDSVRAQAALLLLNADIRAAEAVTSVSPTAIQLTTRVPSGRTTAQGPVETVVWELVGTDLVMTRTAATAGAVPVSRVVLPHVVTDPTAPTRPLFRALTVADSQRQCSTGPTTSSSLAASFSDADSLGRVYAVDVWLSVNSAPTLSPRPLVLAGGAVIANAASTGHLGGTGDIDLPSSSLGLGQGC